MKGRGLCAALLLCISCGSRSHSNNFGIEINEVVPYGSAADWIELYNPYDHPIDISGYYLSDNPDRPRKWQFPQGTMIEARGYRVVTAGDDRLEEIPLHASFGLNQTTGEAVVLTAPDGRTRIDHVFFPPL